MRISLFVVALSLVLPFAAHSQDYQVSVTTIHVWVAVEGSAPALTQNDFEIYEDGKKVTPTCFEKAPLVSENWQQPSSQESGASLQTMPATGPSLKRVVLMIDLLNTSQNELLFMRKKIDEFLKQMEGKTEIMLVGVPPYEELTPFTRDFLEIGSALERVSGNRERDQRVAARIRDIRDELESERKDKVDIAYRTALEGKLEDEQNLQLVFEALEKFHKELIKDDLEQREHTVVILISGGLSAHPGQVYMDIVNRVGGLMDEETRMVSRSRTSNANVIQKALGILNRDNVTVYTINTRGQVDVIDNITESDKKYMADINDQREYSKDYQEVLERVATDTGGVSFHNSLNFKHGFDLILNDLDHQYLLCYVAPEHKNEGDYHKIKVVTKAKGIKIRHRAGYVD